MNASCFSREHQQVALVKRPESIGAINGLYQNTHTLP